jgi:DNA-binding transcriptional regulator/RsmH inhibitor MraZ
LDDKLRTRIPPKFRSIVNPEDGVIIMKYTLSGSIELLSAEKFDALVDKLNVITEDEEDAKLAKTAFLSLIRTSKEDSQYRFVLDRDLAKWAGIKKDIVISAEGNTLEIWAAEVYNERVGAALSKEEYKKLYKESLLPYLKPTKAEDNK